LRSPPPYTRGLRGLAAIDVNGADAHPLYKYLTTTKKGLLGSGAIKWNFTKFLVDTDGKVVERYADDEAGGVGKKIERAPVMPRRWLLRGGRESAAVEVHAPQPAANGRSFEGTSLETGRAPEVDPLRARAIANWSAR
jgi:hypothetical protein